MASLSSSQAPPDNAPSSAEVFNDQLVDKTKKMTKRVNDTIASFRDGNTVKFRNNMFDQFVIQTNPYMNSRWGNETVREWAKGAVIQLLLELYNGQHEFGYGSMGSIWFDTDLTGNGKTKKTRVCIGPSTDDAEEGSLSHNGKKLTIMLDATFSEEW